MREGTTSRVTAADRPYGEFYDFYSVSPENFGSTLVERLPDIVTIQRSGIVLRMISAGTQFQSMKN
jgi:hypothetical protein